MGHVNTTFISPFVESVESLFQEKELGAVSLKEVFEKRSSVMFGDVSGIVGLSGNVTGMVAISFPASLAKTCISTHTGVPPEKLSARELQEGVAELIAMIAEKVKVVLAETEDAFDTSLPAIVTGVGHEIFHRKGVDSVAALFAMSDGQHFTVELCVPSVQE